MSSSLLVAAYWQDVERQARLEDISCIGDCHSLLLTRHGIVRGVVRGHSSSPVFPGGSWRSRRHHIVRRLCLTRPAWQYHHPVSVTAHHPLSAGLMVCLRRVRVEGPSSPRVSRVQIRVGRDEIHASLAAPDSVSPRAASH